MANPHLEAVLLALKVNDDTHDLFGKLGTTKKPRGRILKAYRAARRGLKGNFDDLPAINETLAILEREVRQAGRDIFQDAIDLGEDQGRQEADIYELPQTRTNVDSSSAVVAWMNVLMAQINTIRAMAIGGTIDKKEILGDGLRVGLLSPAPVNREARRWVTQLSDAAHSDIIKQATVQTDDVYMRQAIATIDENTTETCLLVNGQIVGIDEPFVLTGTPRFADEKMNVPFHFECRTSVALIHPDNIDDDLTKAIREASRDELKAQEEGGKQVIHPAFSFSRR